MSQRIEITLESVTKYYGKRPGMVDCSAEINSGKITAIVGKNGSGKSTVLKIILGLICPTSGRCLLNGLKYKPRVCGLKSFGYLPEKLVLPASITIEEMILRLGMARGTSLGDCRERMDDLCRYFELNAAGTLQSGALSHGMAQKTGIILALIHNPNCLVLDEPTNALDPLAKRKLFQKLRELRDEGKTILISSHHLDEVEKLADDVLIFHENRCLGKYPSHHLTGAKNLVKISFARKLTANQLDKVKVIQGVTDATEEYCCLAIQEDQDVNEWVVLLTSLDVGIKSIQAEILSLETAFINVISQKGGAEDEKPVALN